MPLLQRSGSEELALAWRIDTPRIEVWRYLTEADLLGHWLGKLIDGAVSAGRDFVVDHGENYCCCSTVHEYAEPSRLAFSWLFPDEPESEVRFDLEASDNATELQLTHHGLGRLADPYCDGWCVHLSYLEAAALGTPLPLSMFWRLHSTFVQLNRR